MTTTAVAFTVSELQARAEAVEAMLALARIEFERHAALAAAFAYNTAGRYQLRRFNSILDAHWNDLRDEQLEELAAKLERIPRLVGPVLDEGERHGVGKRGLERRMFKSVRESMNQVEVLIERLRTEAARGTRPQLAIAVPQLSEPMLRQAMLASVLLRRVKPDPVDSHPDPDYGL